MQAEHDGDDDALIHAEEFGRGQDRPCRVEVWRDGSYDPPRIIIDVHGVRGLTPEDATRLSILIASAAGRARSEKQRVEEEGGT